MSRANRIDDSSLSSPDNGVVARSLAGSADGATFFRWPLVASLTERARFSPATVEVLLASVCACCDVTLITKELERERAWWIYLTGQRD